VFVPHACPSRRPERRRDIIDKLQSVGFRVSRVVDLTHHENDNRFLEGTGSVVFDHTDHIAYANISPRTNSDVLNELSGTLGYKPVSCTLHTRTANRFFHTDMVMSMAIGRHFLRRSDQRSGERKLVLDSLKATGREIIAIDRKQVEQFHRKRPAGADEER